MLRWNTVLPKSPQGTKSNEAGTEVQPPYVFLNGLWLKRSWGGEVRTLSLLEAAIDRLP
jgi:hypothetical protein